MVFQSKFWSISKMKIKTSMLWSTDETRLITCRFPTFPQGAQIRRPRPSAPRFGDIGWKRFWHRCSTTFNSTINIFNNTNVASDTSISWFCSLLLWEDVLPKLDRKRQVHHTHSTHSCKILSKGHFSILCGSISLHLCPIQSTIQIPNSHVEPPTGPSPNSGPKHYHRLRPFDERAPAWGGAGRGTLPRAMVNFKSCLSRHSCDELPVNKKHGSTSHVWKSPHPGFIVGNRKRPTELPENIWSNCVSLLIPPTWPWFLLALWVALTSVLKIQAVSLSFIVIINQYC